MAWVQQRRADLTALTRKYGETIDDVLAWGRAVGPAARPPDGLGQPDRGARARGGRGSAAERDRARPARWRKARRTAAKRLAAAVTG